MHIPHTTSDLLLRLLNGETDGHFIELMVDRAMECARRYIQWLVWHRGYHLGPTGLSVDDLAYDLIAELVSELEGEMLGRLKSSLRSMLEDGSEDGDLESIFIAIVNRTVRLNLARLFTDINPLQARLLRSLRRYTASSSELTRIESVGGYWYARADADLRLELPAVPLDTLRSALIAESLDGNPVRSVLHAALDTVSRIPDVRQAVAEHDILDITLALLQSLHIAATPDVIQEDTGEDFAAGMALIEALDEARGWAADTYVTSGKLTDAETDAMFRAMTLYFEDIKHDDALGHFSYLRQVMPGLTQSRYRESYRNIYEYILRRIFTRARERLE